MLIAPQPPLSIALALIGALTLGTLNLRAPRLDGRQSFPSIRHAAWGTQPLRQHSVGGRIRAILFRCPRFRWRIQAAAPTHGGWVPSAWPRPRASPSSLPGSRASPGTRIIAVMALGMLSSILIPVKRLDGGYIRQQRTKRRLQSIHDAPVLRPDSAETVRLRELRPRRRALVEALSTGCVPQVDGGFRGSWQHGTGLTIAVAWLRRAWPSRGSCGVCHSARRRLATRSCGLWRDRLLPFGKYWRSRPLVFSFDPRCQGE